MNRKLTVNAKDRSMMVLRLRQLKLLLWKNWIQQRRHWIQLLFEMLLPLLLILLLIGLRSIAQRTPYTHETHYTPVPLDRLPDELIPKREVLGAANTLLQAQDKLFSGRATTLIQQFIKQADPTTLKTLSGLASSFGLASGKAATSVSEAVVYVGFAPVSKLTKKTMRIVQRRLSKQVECVGHSNEDEMLKWLSGSDLSGTPMSSRRIGGVVFTSITNGTRFTHNITVTIRPHSRSSLLPNSIGKWYTGFAYPATNTPGPRNKYRNDGGSPGYISSGFSAIQHAVTMAIAEIQMAATEPPSSGGKINNSNNNVNVEAFAQRMPYKSFIDDPFLLVLKEWLPLMLMLSFCSPAVNIVKNVVLEKELRIKESLKIMGLCNWLHWTAWFIKSLVILFFTIILIPLLLVTDWFPDADTLAVLPESCFSVVFMLILLYACSTICFCFMMSTLFSKARTGAIISGMVFFLTYLPYTFLERNYINLNMFQKVSVCLLHNTAMSFGTLLITNWEGAAEGAHWENLSSNASPDDKLNLLLVFCMLVLDCVLYSTATWYLEALFPGEYGIPQKWYFPFQVYDNGKVAVRGLTFNMYQGQITALLGHNGAGKSTTISMLTGLFPASEGTASINGFDVNCNVDEARASLGICPQHDVLFDELTVEEHLRFYCAVKNFQGDVEREIHKSLTIIQLNDKRNSQVKTLSGGMKRKLSVCIALCAGSKVVLLDEPTSGMDPAARRCTWNIIQKARRERTILLTTHFMDEADVLGDRIAIMARGQLQCCGSPLFLKRKYGAGYHVTMVKQARCDVEQVTNLLRQYIPSVAVDQNIGAELSYALPSENSDKFEELFSKLDENKSQLGLCSYGASVTTMEEVFIRVGIESEQDADVAPSERPNGELNGVDNQTFTIGIETQLENESNSTPPSTVSEQPDRNHGCILIAQQMYALIVKRLVHYRRTWHMTLVQLLIPVFFLILSLLFVNSMPSLRDDPPLTLSPQLFENGISTLRTFIDDWQFNNTQIEQYFSSSLHSSRYTVLDNEHFSNISQFLLEKQNESLSFFNRIYTSAVNVKISPNLASGNKTSGSTHLAITAMFNNQPLHAAGVTQAIVDEMLLKLLTHDSRYTLSVTNHPTPVSNHSKLESQLTGQHSGFTIAFQLSFGLAFLAASFSLFVVKERGNHSRHLQLVSGAGATIYWLVNFVCDYVAFLLSVGGILLTLYISGEKGFAEPQPMGVLAVLYVFYGLALLPHVYLLSFLFREPSTSYTRVLFLSILTGMVIMAVVVIMRIPVINFNELANVLDWVFQTMPVYAVSMGMVSIYSNYISLSICQPLLTQFPTMCQLTKIANQTNKCCPEIGNCGENGCLHFQENYFSLQGLGIGRTIIFLFIGGVVQMALVLLIEHNFFRLMYTIYDNARNLHFSIAWNHDEDSVLNTDVDSDVKQERSRILSDNHASDIFVIKNLTKVYGGALVAVDRLCVGIPPGECFGLLGVNGAGKTSTFKMITGDESIAFGDAFLQTSDSRCFSVNKDARAVHNYIGYCPQFDGLIDVMTGRETLRMYARLRGIHDADNEAIVAKLAARLNFHNDIDKQVGEMSGGNRRKLSTAVSLIGDPPVVFLDEPTTGMDPVARRMLWDVIGRVRANGQSIILSSHSMEECESLCTRLAIMVNGKFKCLGSPQYLKNKFGSGFTLIIKVKIPDDESAMINSSNAFRSSFSLKRPSYLRSSSVMLVKDNMSPTMKRRIYAIKSFISAEFEGCELRSVHHATLHYHIASQNTSWARVFGIIERCKYSLHIEDYSVSQTTLEQVFLNFTQSQQNDD